VCAVNLLCKGTPDDKARVFFSAFDADNSESLDKAEFGNRAKPYIFSPRKSKILILLFVFLSSTRRLQAA
jgi:hypothetical protein